MCFRFSGLAYYGYRARRIAALGLAFCMLLSISTVASQRPVVSLRSGPVVGKPEIYNDHTGYYEYHSFLAIPYALPPVGSLRFKVMSTNDSCALKYLLLLKYMRLVVFFGECSVPSHSLSLDGPASELQMIMLPHVLS